MKAWMFLWSGHMGRFEGMASTHQVVHMPMKALADTVMW